MSKKILLIEDDIAFQAMLCEALEARGYAVARAGSVEEGLVCLLDEAFDLILTDVKLPGASGVEAIPRLKEAAPGADIIVMTAYSTKETAVKAVKLGAYDYFSKPFSLSELEVVVRRALEKQRLQAEVSTLRETLIKKGPLSKIIGKSLSMRQVVSLVAKVAVLETTVLITGESGTGKELVADALHGLSPRVGAPFVKVNCAAIPENLMESELFGHEKGAFTGAGASRPGKFELAQKGTLLLDEIGDMPLAIQPKLLRAVEQKQVERLGGGRPTDIDVRILAATNQDLRARVKEKVFREDLYYRLNVASVALPPLRERKEDIPLLAEYFLDAINARLGTALTGLTPDALDELMAQGWPGNVRQLANTLERAVINAKASSLTAGDVKRALHVLDRQTPSPVPSPGLSLRETLRETEKGLILQALAKTGGRQKSAAYLLGITPKNLWNKKLLKSQCSITYLGNKTKFLCMPLHLRNKLE
ncbi:MAG: sigma-54 dependent transcriptional regulator, partial [Thermodesulfobacteriota bacterium]|nr:sigma-54 dependent transcriptional regulator [Thermodesulfobacteriota bacterium]